LTLANSMTSGRTDDPVPVREAKKKARYYPRWKPLSRLSRFAGAEVVLAFLVSFHADGSNSNAKKKFVKPIDIKILGFKMTLRLQRKGDNDG
jgi:hypothetical protein